MNAEFTCRDGGALAGYLYGEADPAERAVIEAHLAACAACAAELAALGATRSALAAWTPPQTDLGFQIVSARDADTPAVQGASILRPARWWHRPLPAWAQAAAALLIFAAGGALGMRAGDVRTVSQPARPAAATQAPTAAASVSADDLAALEQRLRREIADMRPTTAAAQPVNASATDEQLVQRFRTMLAQSEERQQRELALRLTDLVRDFDSQRRVDLALIERTFGQMEGVTGPELRQQREAINYLIRTASQRPQQ